MAGSGIHEATIRIDGLPRVIAALRAAGDDLTDMSELNYRLGNIVIDNAQPPRESGEVAGTLRAGKGKTKAVVRAGYANRGSYAGVLHYGDPHRGHQAHPFLTDALRRSQETVIRELSKGIDVMFAKHGLT